MTGFFKKLVGKDPLSKTYKEFEKLIGLEEKRQKVLVAYGEDLPKEIALQKDILDNNILTLAHLFGSLKPTILDTKKHEYFNIQGTTVEVFTLHEPKDVYTHVKTKIETPVIELAKLSDLIEEIFTLERKFQSLKQGKMNAKVFGKIQKIALEKINNKVINYCNMFKGNEDLVRKFVFRNMTEPDEDYHNDLLMYERINFIGFLAETTDILDSEAIDISNKELIQINKSDFHTSINIEMFLKELKTYKYDFIIKFKSSGGVRS